MSFIDDRRTKVKLFFFKLRHFSWKRFTGGEKALLIVVGVLLLLFLTYGVLRLTWIKAPDLSNRDDPNQEQHGGEEDDELEQYRQGMPTLSGDRKEGYYTFLLIGTDRSDSNTDTLMLVSYDVPNQQVNIASIPRDTMINASWDIKKINSVFGLYKDGVGALKTYMKSILGFEPDFYVKVDLSAFVELVDLVDGVDFYVPQDMNYDDPSQNLHIHLKEGQQTLDGEHAMELVRFRRYANGDIGRISVQQNFMKALIKQCLSIQNWSKIKGYVDIAAKYVKTDLTLGEMLYFASEGMSINFNDITTCTLPGNYYASAWSRAMRNYQSYVTLYADEMVKLINSKFNPYLTDVTVGMLDIMSINSDGTISCTSGKLQDTKHNSQYLAWLEEKNKPQDPEPEDPGTTDPGSTDPGTTDPGTADPGTTDPGITDPGTTDPGVTDPGTQSPDAPGTNEENWNWLF